MKCTFLLSSLLTVFLLFQSCGSDNDELDPTTDVTNGAVIERTATTSNVIFSDNLEGSLDTLLEYRDAEEGTLLDEMQVFVTFFDNSEELGDSTDAIVGTEVLIKTIDANSFENGANNFPVYNLNIITQEFLDITNNSLDGIASQDIFITRLALILTDGRVFSVDNITNNGNLNTDFAIVTQVE